MSSAGYPSFSGSTSQLPNLYQGIENSDVAKTSPNGLSSAVNIVLLDKATGRPVVSPTGRDLCNPCTYLPNAGGGAPVVDMPLIIDSAGGTPPPGSFTAVVVPANLGGPAVSDQAANRTPPPFDDFDRFVQVDQIRPRF